MKLYSEGTLLKDCTGSLWIVLDHCRHPELPYPNEKTPNAYDVIRLEGGFRYYSTLHVAHKDFEVVSEIK